MRLTPPWAARWLCFCLLLFAQGGRGQLSVGGSNSFLSEDLDYSSDIPAPTQSSELLFATDIPPESTALPELKDELFDSDVAVTATPSPSLEDEVSKHVGSIDYYDLSSDFGQKVVEDEEGNATDLSQIFVSEIISSEAPSPTALGVGPSAVVTRPRPSAVATRPSDAIRVLADPSPDWLPIWPSHLLQSSVETSDVSSVTIPTEAAQTVLASAAAPFLQEGQLLSASPVVPSFTVTKVPVTQYFFDSSAAPTPAPGPLFDPSDFITSSFITPPDTSSDLTKPTIDLVSSIPELQSSVLFEEAVVTSVTPILPSEVTTAKITTSEVTEVEIGSPSIEPPVNMLISTIVPTATVTLVPSRSPAVDEVEVDDNTLGDGDYIDNTTLISEAAEEEEPTGVESVGPRPSLEEQPEQEDPDYFKYTTASESLLDVSTSEIVAAEHPGSTGEALTSTTLLAFTTPPSSLPVTTPDAEEVMTTTPVDRVSVQPTPFFRTSQVADSSRTPLWMLLSKSSPSQTVNTQQTRTQLVSSAFISSAQVSDLAVASPSTPTLESETVTTTFSRASSADAIIPSLESSKVLSDSLVLLATVPLETTTTVVESTDAELEQPELVTSVFEESIASSSLVRTTEGTLVELPNATSLIHMPSAIPVFESDRDVTDLPTAFPSFRTSIVNDTEESIIPSEIEILDESVATDTSVEPQTPEKPLPTSIVIEASDFIPVTSPSSEISSTEVAGPEVRASTSRIVVEPKTSSFIVQPSTLSSLEQPSKLSSLVQSSTVSSIVQPSTFTSLVQASTLSSLVQPSIVSSLVQPSTLSSLVQPSTVSSLVQPTTVSSLVQPTTVSSLVQPTTVSSLVQPSTVSSLVQPSTLSSLEEPSFVVDHSIFRSTLDHSTVSPVVEPSIVSFAVEPSRIPDITATWTPVLGVKEEEEEEITTVLVSSERPQTTTVVQTLAPELIGGFTPIISEISKPSEVVPDSSDLQSLSFVSDVVDSTAVNITLTTKSSTLPPPESPSLVVTSSIQEYDYTESVLPADFSSIDESVLPSRVPEEILVTSTKSLPKPVKSTLHEDSESETLIPSFDVVSSTLSPTTVGTDEYDSVFETDTVGPIVVSEIFSSPAVFITELFTTPEPSEGMISDSILTSMDTTIVNTTSASASASPITPVVSAAFPTILTTLTPDSSTPPSLSADPETVFLAPTQTLATTSDLPALVVPTATEPTIEEDIATDVFPYLDVDVEPGVESTSEETYIKEEPTEEPDESSPVPPARPSPPTSTTPATTTTKTTTAKVTIPASTTTTTTTTPVPTTPPSEVSITFIIPTEAMPTLTTILEFPNGTVVDQPLPYVRARVGYSRGEFCQHQHKFTALLAQWLSKSMKDVSVSPEDIIFFNMPDCKQIKPPTDEHLNQLPEDPTDTDQDTGDKLPSDTEKETDVYFYITKSGKIDTYLTEQFPLYPTELEISEELMYLKPKVKHLELVRPDGTRDSNLLVEEEGAVGTSVIVIIVISTLVGATILIALIFFLLLRKRGAANNYYGRRCTPVSMDAYSMDSVSVYHSFRRKSKRRASGRSIKSYLNQAFDDPNGPSRPLNFAKLTHFISDIDGVYEEFSTIPVNMPKYDELPAGVEDKNRYANVIPVPETRVLLKASKESPNADYINANYVRGPRNESKYYIATQAPLDDTVADFWKMVWEQETRVVVMLTDFVEKGIDKCADYLPPSETLDCHRVYGEFQVTLKSRDMKEKFVVSNVQLKNLENNLVREVAHMWFTGWPTAGVPNEESGFISFILEVRRNRKKLRAKGPVVVHCSPGTGRTGAFLACDIVMRQFEDQRTVDVARTVYSIRRDRAGAVQTKEQYAFIYRVINLYASKLTTGNLDSL